jgi:hypothetical protein
MNGAIISLALYMRRSGSTADFLTPDKPMARDTAG